MKDKIKRLKEAVPGFVTAVIEMIMGVSLLLDPTSFATRNIETIGMILIAVGAVSILSYFRRLPQAGVRERSLSIGVLTAALGVFGSLSPEWFIATFPELVGMYGIGMLVLGTFKTETVVNMLRLKQENWCLYAVNAAVTVICAVLILLSPLGSSTGRYIFAGLAFILEAVIDFTIVLSPGRREPGKG